MSLKILIFLAIFNITFWLKFPSVTLASCDQSGTYNVCNNSGSDWNPSCDAPYWDGSGYYGTSCPGIANGSCGTCQFKHCSSAAEAASGSCGGAGLTTPSCSIGTYDNFGNPKTVFNNGDRINIRLNASDTGEVYSGPQSGYQSFPTFSGRCSGPVGFCGSGNLCTSACSNVCSTANGGGDLRLTANNPSNSQGTCNISWTVNNSAGQSSCSFAVTINAQISQPNLQVTGFSVPDGSIGQSVNATVVVRNVGSASTGGSFEVAINRNRSSMNCSTNEHASVVTAALLAGASRTLTIPMTLPNSIGGFTAVAMADSDCQITESNENDNTRTDTYQVASACTSVLPTVSLVSPDDNATLPSRTEVNLDWNQDFGAVCPLPNPGNQAHLKISDSDGTVVLDSDVVPTRSDYDISNLSCEHEYSWQVKVTNGVEEVSSPVRKFTMASCALPSSNGFFSTFGGGVLAAGGDLVNSNVPAGRFISENLASQSRSAGVVSGYPLNTIGGGGGYSEQGFNLASYESSGAERNGADYESLLSNVLKAGGFSASNLSEVCGSDPVTIAGKEARFSCWNGGSLTGAFDQALADLTKIQIIVPQEQTSQFQSVVLSGSQLRVDGKHIVVFVPSGVSVTNEVDVDSSNDSTLTVVSSGDLTFGSGLNRVDGSFITGGDFSDGSLGIELDGEGQILAFGSVSLSRQVTGQAAEEISYHGKYLAALWHILARPKVTWTEVSPK